VRRNPNSGRRVPRLGRTIVELMVPIVSARRRRCVGAFVTTTPAAGPLRADREVAAPVAVGQSGRVAETGTLLRDATKCAVRVFRLLAGRRLHLRTARIGSRVSLPDGRVFVVFRESTCDGSTNGRPVTLAVWFHLKFIPSGARVRRWLFERLCILNTVLFAGFDGYLVKLWMVDPFTSDYAGLYSWASSEEAERYGSYITAVLRPLSRPGTVGFRVLPESTLDEYLQRAPSSS